MLKQQFLNKHAYLQIFMRCASTTSLLETLKSSSDRMTQDVAKHLLNNYELEDINKTNEVGFWWHEKRLSTSDAGVEGNDTGVGIGISMGSTHGLNVIYAHATCNPKTHRDHGPWQTEIKYGSFWKSDKSKTKTAFEKVGFTCTQNDGKDTGQGDKALSFKNPNP